jgi:hypothetical protein
MTIKLNIEIESPLTPDDRDLLSGIAVMTLAIANRELAQQGFPDTFPPDEPQEEAEPQPCGSMEFDQESANATGRACASPVGHPGRHKYRPVITNIGSVPEGMN